MIIQCKSCSRKFTVQDSDIPDKGRTVQCGYCSVTWHQKPDSTSIKTIEKPKIKKLTREKDEGPSIDNLKASDGKTYRFLGSQWAELLPSGKTGLFARKKISKELDEITGRKEQKTTKKKRKKLEEVNPSSESLETGKKLPEVYKPKEGLGFFWLYFSNNNSGIFYCRSIKNFRK